MPAPSPVAGLERPDTIPVRSPLSARIALAVVLAFGLWVRLMHPGVVDFSADAAGRYRLSRAIVTGRSAPLVGRELSGLADRGTHGPTMYYVDALPFLVSRNPLSLATFLALLHAVGIAVTYRLGLELAGPTPGLVAALLTAGSSVLSYWTRDLMNPSYLALGTPLVHWLLWRAVRADRSRAVFGFVLAVVFFSEFHLLVIAALPMAAVLWAVLRPRLAWRWLGAGILASAVFFLPLVIHGVRSGDWNPIAGWVDVLFRASVGHGGPVWSNALAPVRVLLEPCALEAWLPAPLGGSAAEWHHRAGAAVAGWIGISLALLAFHAAASVASERGRGRRISGAGRADVFLLVAIVLDSLALASIRTEFYSRYVLTVLPIPFVAAGVAVDRVASWCGGSRTLRRAVQLLGLSGAVGIVVATNVEVIEVVHRLEATRLMQNQRPTYAAQLELAEALVSELGLVGRADVERRLHSESGPTYGIADLVEHLVVDLHRAPGRSMPDTWAVRMARADDPYLATAESAALAHALVVPAPPFTLVGDRARVQSASTRLEVQPPDESWIAPSFDDRAWRSWNQKFYGRASDGTVAIRVPVRFEPDEAGRRITLWSRACVEKAWFDGILVRDTPCPRARRQEEVDRDRTDVILGPTATRAGDHVLALFTVIRDKWYDLEIFDAPLGPSDLQASVEPGTSRP